MLMYDSPQFMQADEVDSSAGAAHCSGKYTVTRVQSGTLCTHARSITVGMAGRRRQYRCNGLRNWSLSIDSLEIMGAVVHGVAMVSNGAGVGKIELLDRGHRQPAWLAAAPRKFPVLAGRCRRLRNQPTYQTLISLRAKSRMCRMTLQ